MRGCSSGKVGFRTEGAAFRALRRIALDNAQAAAPVAAEDTPRRQYRCHECGQWHLTKQTLRRAA